MADVLFSNTENISIASEDSRLSPILFSIEDFFGIASEDWRISPVVFVFSEQVSANEGNSYPTNYIAGPVVLTVSDTPLFLTESFRVFPLWWQGSDQISFSEPSGSLNQIQLSPIPFKASESITFSETNVVRAFPIPFVGSDLLILSEVGSRLFGQIIFTTTESVGTVYDFPNKSDEDFNGYTWNPDLRRSFVDGDSIEFGEIYDFLIPLTTQSASDEIRFTEVGFLNKFSGGVNLPNFGDFEHLTESYTFLTTKGGEDVIGFAEFGCICLILNRGSDDEISLTERGLLWNATTKPIGTPDGTGSGATFRAIIRKTVVESIAVIERGGRSDDFGNLLPEYSCCYPATIESPIEGADSIFIYETYNVDLGGEDWSTLTSWESMDTWAGLN